MRRDPFSALHPALAFSFFAAVLLITMLVMHPAFLAVSLLSAAGYSICLGGRKAIRFQLLGMLPMMLIVMCMNPLFNHRGVTTLFFLPNGNPVTWEAVAYGIASAAMFCAVILWFYCYNRVMSSDKFISLFGRLLPSVSLLLSMALRFVPQFRRKIGEVAQAQRALGKTAGKGLMCRVKGGIRVLSITVTWALERAVETADSMKSRGYGLRGRTHYALYRFDTRDKVLLAVIVLLGAGMLAAIAAGQVTAEFYPAISLGGSAVGTAVSAGLFAVFCNIPVILWGKEALQWRALRSKI